MSGWAQRDAERQEDEYYENNKSCITCGKDDNKTGEPCPTRKGCHFPDYKEWAPVTSPEDKKTGWEIISFCWTKFDDHLLINLKHKGCGVIMVTVSPDDIAGLALPGELKEEIDSISTDETK